MTKRLDGIEQRASNATPGPWTLAGTAQNPCPVVSAHGESGYQIHSMLWVKKHGEGEYPFMKETYCKDADFIAHAREDIPYLIARLRRAEELLHDVIRCANTMPTSLGCEFDIGIFLDGAE